MNQINNVSADGQTGHSPNAKFAVRCVTCSRELEVDLDEGIVADAMLGESVEVEALPASEHGGSPLLVRHDCMGWMKRLREAGLDPDIYIVRSAIEIGSECAQRRDLPPEVVVERHLVRLYEFAADLRNMRRAQFLESFRRGQQRRQEGP